MFKGSRFWTTVAADGKSNASGSYKKLFRGRCNTSPPFLSSSSPNALDLLGSPLLNRPILSLKTYFSRKNLRSQVDKMSSSLPLKNLREGKGTRPQKTTRESLGIAGFSRWKSFKNSTAVSEKFSNGSSVQSFRAGKPSHSTR